MATITPHLRTGKERDGSSPIYIRVSHKGKECFVTLGIKASERDWNRRQLRLRKSYAGFFEANAYVYWRAAVSLRARPFMPVLQLCRKKSNLKV